MTATLIEKLNFKQLKYQYLAVFCVNIVCFCQGFAYGWVSPSLDLLKSENSPLQGGPMKLYETMLIGILPPVGALIGIILLSIVSKHLGSMTLISLLAFPNMTLWIILMASNSIEIILLGQLISGITLAGTFLSIPLFVADISDKSIRGFLGLISSLNFGIGILVAYTCGALVDYDNLPYVIIIFPVVFFVGTTILPETPSSLLRQNKIESAKKSLQFYYNGNSADKNGFDAESEFEKLQALVNQRETNVKQSSMKLILNKQSLKGIGIGFCLTVIVVFSGTFAITQYASQVFKETSAYFDANVSAIILGTLQVLGTASSFFLIETWGRKKLFAVSSILSAVALFIFGTFSYLNHRGTDMTPVFWLPVTTVSFYIFVNSAGMRPLPFVYVAELLPDNVRPIGTSICMFAFTASTIISVGSLPVLIEVIQLHAVMWLYGGICSLGIVFSIIMEETKGKNLNIAQ